MYFGFSLSHPTTSSLASSLLFIHLTHQVSYSASMKTMAKKTKFIFKRKHRKNINTALEYIHIYIYGSLLVEESESGRVQLLQLYTLQ